MMNVAAPSRRLGAPHGGARWARLLGAGLSCLALACSSGTRIDEPGGRGGSPEGGGGSGPSNRGGSSTLSSASTTGTGGGPGGGAGAGGVGGAGGAAQPVPLHLLTMDYGDAYLKPNAGGTLYRTEDLPYLSMAQLSAASNAVHFQPTTKTVFYTFGMAAFHGQKYWTALGGGASGTGNQPGPAFTVDCAKNDLVYYGAMPYEYSLDWSQTATQDAYVATFVTPNAAFPIDYFYLDGPFHDPTMSFLDAVTLKAGQHPCPGGVSLTDQQWFDSTAAGIHAALGNRPALFEDAGTTINRPIAGGRNECTYVCNAKYASLAAWQASEDIEIAAGNAGKIQMLQTGDYGGGFYPSSPTGQEHRLFGLASILLTYALETTYWWPLASAHSGAGQDEDPLNLSGERIYPESGLVATNPVVAHVDDISMLRDGSSGAYFRKYAACYYRGKLLGSCLVAVNPSTSTVAFPDPAFTASGAQTMVLHNGNGSNDACTVGTPAGQTCEGAEIPNGGTVTFDGGPAPATMPPNGAVIAIL